MSDLFKNLLMCLLMLALPFQGLAQASMIACHLEGRAPAAGSSAMIFTKSASADMEHADKGHGRMTHSMDPSGDHSMHTGQTTGVEPDGKSVATMLHGCCNCAPGCTAALLPVAVVQLAAVESDSLSPVFTREHPHSADSRRLDRPPKEQAI